MDSLIIYVNGNNGTLLLSGILPVEISMENDILLVEIFYGKWHFTSGLAFTHECIQPSFGKLDHFYRLNVAPAKTVTDTHFKFYLF